MVMSISERKDQKLNTLHCLSFEGPMLTI